MALKLATQCINVNRFAQGLIPVTVRLFTGGKEAGSSLEEGMLSHIPLGRLETAEEVAKMVLFLSDDGSEHIPGNILAVDGGWACGYPRDF
jgi:NAD(P)-dependent dehydrogenase (short-subunit alcohol dehydrogenase family)